MTSDEQAIRKVIADWHEQTKQGDLDGVLDFMTDDVVFLTCGRPPMTKRDFEAGFRSMAGKMQIDSKFELKALEVSGNLAYAWSFISLVVTSSADASRTERSGNVLSVFRKSPAGAWQLARDANFVTSAEKPAA